MFTVLEARLAPWYEASEDVTQAWKDGKDFQDLTTGQYFSIRDSQSLFIEGVMSIAVYNPAIKAPTYLEVAYG